MIKFSTLVLMALAIGLAPRVAPGQIKAFTLEQMVEDADDAVFGEIVSRRVFRIDHPIDGPELYFTTLTIAGNAVADGTRATVDVTYHGGFISPGEGVFNSEAPIADDVKIGNRVVVFYRWSDNLGGDVAGNVLMAAHGGLYRTVSGPSESVVLGRGEGYAIDFNVKVSDLGQAIGRIRDSK